MYGEQHTLHFLKNIFPCTQSFLSTSSFLWDLQVHVCWCILFTERDIHYTSRNAFSYYEPNNFLSPRVLASGHFQLYRHTFGPNYRVLDKGEEYILYLQTLNLLPVSWGWKIAKASSCSAMSLDSCCVRNSPRTFELSLTSILPRTISSVLFLLYHAEN